MERFYLLGLIWAEDSNGVIGGDNKLLWHIPEDLQFFKEATLGATVLMGRNTWDSLPEKVRPLPGRRNIVVSRSLQALDGADVYSSLSEALDSVEGDVWCIGGGQLYKQLIHRADKALVTLVETQCETGDTYAPNMRNSGLEIDDVSLSKLSQTGYNYSHITLIRVDK